MNNLDNISTYIEQDRIIGSGENTGVWLIVATIILLVLMVVYITYTLMLQTSINISSSTSQVTK